MQLSRRCALCGVTLNSDNLLCTRCQPSSRQEKPAPTRFPAIFGAVAGISLLAFGLFYLQSHNHWLTSAPSHDTSSPAIIAGPQRKVTGPAVLAAPLRRPSGAAVVAAPNRPPTGPAIVNAPSKSLVGPSLAHAMNPQVGPSVASAPAEIKEQPSVVLSPKQTSAPPVARVTSIIQAPVIKEDPYRVEVLVYLKKMKEVENHRKVVVRNLLPGILTLSAVQGMMGRTETVPEGSVATPRVDPSSLHYANSTFTQYRSELSGIQRQAGAIRPPAPAAPFHRSYLTAVENYDGAVSDISAAMMNMDRSLAQRVGSLQGRVERSLNSSDEELRKLLERYDLERNFTVSDD